MFSAAECPACGASLVTATAKFCMECGTPLVPLEPPVEVRKTVTLLFTDVTGSTALGEALDPEALRGLMGRYFAVARAAVERHGGVVEKFVGDAVLAVFGLPDVREDDALRAVRAAADLQAGMAVLADELASAQGVTLAIRTGVNTGPVVTGAERAGGSFATGDAVNTAARLEQAAGPGEVLLGQPTYDLVRDAVEAVEVEPVAAKGKAERVRAHRLVSVDAAAAGRARRPDAPLVGREREVRALEDALERTIELGRGHLVTITGGPGLGKTRLVTDFLERAGSRATVLSGRCLSYGRGITYFPLVQILRDGAGLIGTESPEITKHAVGEVLADLPVGDRLAEVLLPLLGAGGEPGSAEDTHEAVVRFLEQVALRRPVVLQVDDLHWAEPPLLDLLDLVRQETADLPLLLVGQARPELLEQRPSWGQGATNAVTIGLEPFDASATRSSLASMLGEGVPAEVEEAVARWSGGNPLFVEEIVTHLRETGLLLAVDGGWTVIGELESAGVPATVSALLAARLGRLPAAEQSVLQAISVVGLELTNTETTALAGADAERTLSSLVRRDLLRRVRGPLGDTWAFRHVLIREAAYDALPMAERSRLHTVLADHLDADPGQAGGERPAFVAHHRLQAATYAAQLAPHAPATVALADAAAGAAAAATEEVVGKEQSPVADILRDALALPVSMSWRRHLLMSLLAHLETFYLHDQVPEVLDELDVAFADAPKDGLEWRTLEMSRLAVVLNSAEPVDPRPLRAAAEEVYRSAQAAGEPLPLHLSLLALISTYAMEARWEPILALLREHFGTGRRAFADYARSLEHAALFHGPRHLSEILSHAREGAANALTAATRVIRELEVTVTEVALGEPAALASLDERTTPEKMALASHFWFRLHQAQALELAGRLDESAQVLGGMVVSMIEVEDVTHASTYLAMEALQRYQCGLDATEVAAMIERAATWTSPYDVVSVAMVETGRALTALRRGDHERALSHSSTALSTIDRSDQLLEQASLRRLLAEIPRTLGDVVQEHRLLSEALTLYDRKGVVTWRPEVVERLAQLKVGPTP